MNELRQELEARSLSTKGLKTQLAARLISALKKEEEEGTNDSENKTETETETETVIEEEKYDIDDLERSEDGLMEVDKVEDEKIEEETSEVVEVRCCVVHDDFLFPRN